MNIIVLIGRLVQNPEVNYTSKNKAYCRFTIAVNRPYKSASGDKQADFINCIAWDYNAENLAKYCAKGNQIAVHGNLQINSYKDKDGKNATTYSVFAEKIEYLQSKTNVGYGDYYNNYKHEQLNAYGEVVNPTPHDFEMQKKQEVFEEKYEQDMEELNLSNADLPF